MGQRLLFLFLSSIIMALVSDGDIIFAIDLEVIKTLVEIVVVELLEINHVEFSVLRLPSRLR